MNVNIIATIGKNNEIGKYNGLIWALPRDFRFFRETTMGKPIIMGRKTFESFPNKLYGGTSVIVSSQKLENNYDVICCHDVLDALEAFEKEEIFVAGGESIYEQLLPFADTMFLTEINAYEYEADAYFPYFDKNEWNISNIESGIESGVEYQRNKYVRKRVK